jgi:hypothetical protein
MKKNRGSSLTEVVAGAGLMMLITLGTLTLFAQGLTAAARTSTDLTISGKNAQGNRYVCEWARAAMSSTIDSTGNKVTFTVPALSGTADSVTGEKEYVFPATSDGVSRGFMVDFNAGTLTDLKSNRVIVKNITSTDPDPKSSNYGQSYQPFSIATIGSRKAIVIQLITKDKVNGSVRYSRMKNTVLLRNTSW